MVRPGAVPHSPNTQIAFDARVGAPICSQGHHLGWIWCTDREQQMTDEQLRRLGAFADEAAIVLYREMLLLDLDRSRRENSSGTSCHPTRIRQEACGSWLNSTSSRRAVVLSCWWP